MSLASSMMLLVCVASGRAQSNLDTGDTSDTADTGGETGDTRPRVEDSDAVAEEVWIQSDGCGEGSSALALFLPALAFAGRRLRRA